MPLFQYRALNKLAEELRGKVEAADARAAAAALRYQSLFVIEINHDEEIVAVEKERLRTDVLVSLRNGIGQIRPIRMRDRVFFFQQMALMLKTGLTLLQALEVCRQQTSKLKFQAAIGRIRHAIQSGKSFSQALALENPLFPVIAIKLIEGAEKSGDMEVVLEQIAIHLEQKQQLKHTLLTGLTYPAIVLLTSIAVMAFLVGNVIPKFAKFLTARQKALPPSTQFLMDLSGFVNQYGLLIVVIVVGSLIALQVFYTTSKGRYTIDRVILLVPVIGGLLNAGAMAHLGRTLSMLLRSGVTLLDALKSASGIIGNRAISKTVEQSAGQILSGQNLAGALRHPVIPELVLQVIAVGERTGALSQVLENLGNFYERELQNKIKQMTALIEPVMILILGGMVGFVYFAFFQAALQLAAGGR